MKRIKSILLLSTTLIFLCFALTGCGDDETSRDTATENNTSDDGNLMDDMENGVDDAVNGVEDAADDVIDGADDMMNDVKDDTDKATDGDSKKEGNTSSTK